MQGDGEDDMQRDGEDNMQRDGDDDMQRDGDDGNRGGGYCANGRHHVADNARPQAHRDQLHVLVHSNTALRRRLVAMAAVL